MADITMCTGGYCTMKQTCYRFKATPNMFGQAYFKNPPYDGVHECGNSKCDHYIMVSRLWKP